jgi:tetratricopeptide (TPR) repeat protein
MAPRRGGSGGAGEVAGTARNYFEPPPLKRMYPWAKDGRNVTDIMAGGVDESGLFKGVYVSGVHMAALLRTFQLAKVFMPTDVPTPVAQLGQNLEDGTPLIIVTRGCFGRSMDYGPGPTRNQSQGAIWETVREIRAQMPQVYITCVDLPINLSSDHVQAVLEPPLNEYRELMYDDGTWYTPTVVPCAGLAVWCEDNRREYKGASGTAIKFQRKKFAWRNQEEFHQGKVLVTWKAVHESRPKQEVTKRTDLDFTGKEQAPVGIIKFSGDSAAEHTFKKALTKAEASGSAKEILSAVTGYLLRALPSEKETLGKAVEACAAAAALCKSDAAEAFGAKRLGVTAKFMTGSVDEAKAEAKKLISSESKPVIKAKAYRLLVDCHYKNGDLDLALETADEARKDFAKLGNPEAIAEGWQMVVTAYIRKGDTAGAIEAAETAAKSSDKMGQAFGCLLVGGANKMSPGVAATSYGKAKTLFSTLGEKRYLAGAIQACISALCASGAEGDAAAAAKELVALGKESFPAKESLSKEALDKLPVTKEEGLCYQAIGHMLVVIASMSQYINSGSYLAGEAELLSSAKAAVELFKEVGCTEGSTQAEQLLANATLATEMPAEALKVAEKVMATSKLLGSPGRGLFETLANGAAACVQLGSFSSAYSAACEVGTLEDAGVWDAGAVARNILDLVGKQQADVMVVRLGCTMALL